MQTLGLSESTPRTESRWRALLWPTIRNDGDFDYITRQGMWICLIVGAFSVVSSGLSGFPTVAALEGTFFFLAGLGVRQRSRVAAVAAFAAYLLRTLVAQRYTGNGFGIGPIICLALLFANIRGNWLSARWAADQQAIPSAALEPHHRRQITLPGVNRSCRSQQFGRVLYWCGSFRTGPVVCG
jgi:hypothetical protein